MTPRDLRRRRHPIAEPHGPPIQATAYYVATGLDAIHVILRLIVASFPLYRAYGGYYLDHHPPLEYFRLY